MLEYALFDKAMYLMLTFAAIGLLSAFIWSTLLIDRRDAIVLGAMPVTPRAILGGKLLALAIYAGMVSVGMHSAAAVLYGGCLGALIGPAAIVRMTGAHFLASSALSLFVFASAHTSIVALGAAVALAAVGYPIACRRVRRAAVDGGGPTPVLDAATR